ncbi:MAG: MATE family efflux transporter [Clostridium sp.]|nr:MATE family efflux transporter [Clostridium sp.]
MENLENPTTEAADSGRLNELATGSVGRLLLRYSIPAVVGMLVNSLYNIVDRIFIGQGVGPEAIAGLSITFPVMNISAAVGVLIGVGASARISILLGAKRRGDAEHVLGNSMTLTLVNALVYIGIFAIFIDPVLRAFGASDVTLPYARDYMVWLLPGLLLTNLSFSFNNIMRASGYPTRAMVTMFIGAGANIILDPIFIFWLDMGIRGAAIATNISMAVSALFVISHFFNPRSTLRFRRGTYGLRWSIILPVIGIGAAPSLVNFANCFINVLLNRSLYHYGGDTAIAAAGIFSTYASLLTMGIIGLCQGMQPIIGYNYGAGHYGRLQRTYLLAVAAASVVCVVGELAGLTVPNLIARAFTKDAGLIAMTDHAFRCVFVMFWVVGFQIVSTTLFQSLGKVGRSIFLSLSRQVIFLIPLLLWLPGIMDLDGVWYAFPASDVMATVVTVILVLPELRRLRRHSAAA